MLILLFGLPGSGKTTLAKAYAQAYGALHLNSDMLREEMGLRGQYREEDKARVYAELMRRVKEGLLEGRDVLVDSTFYKKSIREPFVRLAAELGIEPVWVEIQADEALIRERVSKPRPHSEADFSVYQKIKAEFEPLEEEHMTLYSGAAPLDALVEVMHHYLYDHES